MVASVASAETVAWWRFEDTPGTRTEAGDTLVNTVTGAHALPGLTPRSISGTTFGTTAKYMPSYTNAFSTGYRIYDPVTRTSYANEASLSLRDELTTNSSKDNGVATLSAEDFPTNGNVTIECFYRAPTISAEDVSNVTNAEMSQILILPIGSYEYSAVIALFNKDGPQKYYFGGASAANGEVVTQVGGGYGSYVPDDKWHHVALVFDFSNGKLNYYADYALVGSVTLSGDGVYVKPGEYLMIGGGNKLTYRKFQGHVDEVRISTAALTADQFLRMVPATASPADELAHVTFESPSWWGGGWRPVMAASPRFALPSFAGNSSKTPTNVVSGCATVYAGVYDGVGAANAVAVDLRRTSKTTGSYLTLEDQVSETLLKDVPEFTIEFLAKFNSAEHDAYWPILSDGRYNNRWVFAGDCDGRQLTCYVYVATNQTGSLSSVGLSTGVMSESVCDGNWHHFALRVSTTNKFAIIDVDYGRLAHAKEALPAATVCFAAQSTTLCVAGMTQAARYCDMVVDEIRVTRRILEDYEFLNKRHAEENVSTRARIRFENDWTIGPDFGLGPLSRQTLIREKGSAGSVYPSLVASATCPYLQESESALKIANAANASLTDHAVAYSADWPMVRNIRNATYEVFLKVNMISNSVESSKFVHPFWVGLSSTNPDVGLRISRYNKTSHLAYVVWRNGESTREVMTIPSDFDDGQWHHHAITFSETTDAASGAVSMTVSYYRDYELKNQDTYDSGRVMSTLADANTRIGTGETWGEGYDFQIDEVRISAGVLEPSDFMKLSGGGLYIIFR